VDLEVDPGYLRIARVRRSDRSAGRSVPTTQLDDLPQPASGRWRFVVGEGQTDVVSPGIDKGFGLWALARHLQPCSTDPLLELAVGDTESDVPMLRLARRPFAPANASPGLRASQVPVLRSAYQSGLAESVGHVIGHRPGTCGLCAPKSMTPERKLLLQVLSVQEGGGAGMPRRLGSLASAVARRGIRR
jgi:hypothetical protein